MTKAIQLRDVDNEAPWRWLAGGWADFCKIAPQSSLYGGVFVLGGLCLSALLWRVGLSSWIPVMAGGFALIGPLFALGLYEAGRRLEQGEPVTLAAMAKARPRAPDQMALLAVLLLVVFFAWSRAAVGLFAALMSTSYLPLMEFATYAATHPSGLALLATGTLVGAVFAFGVFALTALSMPMLLERNVDAVTAMITSVKAVTRQPRVMILWAWIIAVIIAVTAMTAFIGLVIGFPVLGLATWRAYRDMIEPAPAEADAMTEELAER